MNLTSFFANKCFEYLLKCDSNQEDGEPHSFQQQKTAQKFSSRFTFPPPWAVDVYLFKKLCDGCGECLSHCENNIIDFNEEGYPVVDFSKGPCSFCGVCAQNCPKGALHYRPDMLPWNIHVSIARNCLMNNRVICNTCVGQCDKEAIIFPKVTGKDQAPEVLAAKCNGCGACYRSCPAGAIVFQSKNDLSAQP